MGRLLPDPELERLVQEMNRLTEGERAVTPTVSWDAPDVSRVSPGGLLDDLLAEMVHREGTDLLLVPGSAPVIRVHGRLEILTAPVIKERAVQELFGPHLGRRAQAQIGERGAADFSLRLAEEGSRSDWRFRVNIQRQGGRLAAAVRALPRRVPTLEELHLPTILGDVVAASGGLILVCGATGSGKSTTLAALVDRLNRTELRHVITIEDPVEYEHCNRQAVIEQVEVGSDSPEFATALRSALRRDPDVLLVGEMRDLETISTVLTAAETGHLVLSTLHTADAQHAVHRVIDVFPAAQQEQVRQQLALSLRAVICQQLVPTTDGRSRMPAVELLLATYAVRNQIRRGKVDRLYNELVSGRSLGMQSMDQALADLVRAGAISVDESRARSSRPDELDRILGTTA